MPAVLVSPACTTVNANVEREWTVAWKLKSSCSNRYPVQLLLGTSGPTETGRVVQVKGSTGHAAVASPPRTTNLASSTNANKLPTCSIGTASVQPALSAFKSCSEQLQWVAMPIAASGSWHSLHGCHEESCVA
jgi:hypothetical protein